MTWDPSVYSLLAFATAGVSAGVILLAWRQRFLTASDTFFGVMLAIGAWSLLYSVQLGFTTLGPQLTFQRLVIVAAAAVPSLWLVFAVQYTRQMDRIPRWVLAGLLVEPILIGVLTLTNPDHGFVIEQVRLVPVGESYGLALSFGPAYLAHVAYSYAIIAVGMAIFVEEYRRSELYRTQVTLLVLGPVPALLTHVAHTLGWEWGPVPAVDLTPIVFAVTGLLFAIVQFDLLDRVPTARKLALEETNDGFVVLDSDGTIVSLNPAAREILQSPEVGQSLWECYPTVPDGERTFAAIDGTTLRGSDDAVNRATDVSTSRMVDHHGTHIGWVITLRDVTDRQAYEQRLEVAHRILRHNLRNDLNVIHGWADTIARTGPAEYTASARRITETASGLIALSEKTQTMVATATFADAEPTAVSIADVVDSVVTSVRRDYPSLTIEMTVPADATAMVPDDSLLSIAVYNLVENAAEHNDADVPQIAISTERGRDGSYHRVVVSDNGPGINEMERNVFNEAGETPLHHGSGLGLWLVYWCVTAAGGELSFTQNEPRGSVVSFTLPAVSAGND